VEIQQWYIRKLFGEYQRAAIFDAWNLLDPPAHAERLNISIIWRATGHDDTLASVPTFAIPALLCDRLIQCTGECRIFIATRSGEFAVVFQQDRPLNIRARWRVFLTRSMCATLVPGINDVGFSRFLQSHGVPQCRAGVGGAGHALETSRASRGTKRFPGGGQPAQVFAR
jgi:hypothetical protein